MTPDFLGICFEFQGDTLGIERRWPEDSAGQIPSKLLPSSLAKYGFIVWGNFALTVFKIFGQVLYLMEFGDRPGVSKESPEGLTGSRNPLI